MRSLAIIGSKGMVGSDLLRFLKPYFQVICGIDRENYNKYRGQSFDVVVNANGNSNKVWANKNILSDFEASTVSVYKTLFDFPCKIYIYISSSDVYPDHTSEKTTNESTTVAPAESLSPYGFHKYLSECIVKNFLKNYIILRCPMVLGNNLKKGPIYDILHNTSLFVTADSRFRMITTKELAKIISFFLEKNIKKEVFNVGGRGTVLLSEITKYIKRPLTFPKDGETHVYETDVSKLGKIYPLKTSVQYLKDFLKKL